jgi:energy-coupling factor transporter ATP-binding protein EcfA2
MKLRIERLILDGGNREVNLKSGLNVITGPIASGKTTMVKLLRGLLGASLNNLPPEAKLVTTLVGQLVLNDKVYSVARPNVTTTTARVDVAGETEAVRLPVLQPEKEAPTTYVRWLLDRLDLPRIEVPSAPTRPDSEPTPLTLNDYLLYCTLYQDELGFSIFGHTDTYKNIKRKYVFQVVYGLYNVEMARLQEELRRVLSQLRQLKSQDELFSQFLGETSLGNRAEIEVNFNKSKQELTAIEGEMNELAHESRRVAPSSTEVQQKQVLELEREVQQLRVERAAEEQSSQNLETLAAQLEAQIGRITRSIVAQKHLLDIEFIVCPRCGSSLPHERGDDDHCYLCLQTLIEEQGRLEAELLETRDLIASREGRLKAIETGLVEKTRNLELARRELEFLTTSFVSAQANRITALGMKRGELKAQMSKFQEYLAIYKNLDAAKLRIGELEEEREALQQQLTISAENESAARTRVSHLATEFNRILERFQPPEFGEELNSSVDSQTYLPLFRGRRFDDLSSPGLGTLVGLAYALAHQKTSLDLNLKLPNILFVDGLSEHLGQEGLDPQRLRAVYEFLIELSSEYGDRLQMIIVDNEVPEIAKDYIQLELSDSDRLIRIN